MEKNFGASDSRLASTLSDQADVLRQLNRTGEAAKVQARADTILSQTVLNPR